MKDGGASARLNFETLQLIQQAYEDDAMTRAAVLK
jgi:hypothetical protein